MTLAVPLPSAAARPGSVTCAETVCARPTLRGLPHAIAPGHALLMYS